VGGGGIQAGNRQNAYDVIAEKDALRGGDILKSRKSRVGSILSGEMIDSQAGTSK